MFACNRIKIMVRYLLLYFSQRNGFINTRRLYQTIIALQFMLHNSQCLNRSCQIVWLYKEFIELPLGTWRAPIKPKLCLSCNGYLHIIITIMLYYNMTTVNIILYCLHSTYYIYITNRSAGKISIVQLFMAIVINLQYCQYYYTIHLVPSQ